MNLSPDRIIWRRVRLGEVIARSKEQTTPSRGGIDRYVAGGHFDEDKLTVERSGDMDDGGMGSTFKYVFRPGQVLFVSASMYLRKIGVAQHTGVVADKTYVLEPIPGAGVLQEFMPWILLSDRFYEFSISQATGSMNARLLWSTMQRFEFDLPPLDEQQRIADLLWAIENDKTSASSLLGQIKASREVWLDSSLAPLRTRSLSSVASLQNGRPVASGDYGDDGLRLLRPGDIRPYGVTEWSESSVSIPETYGSEHPEAVLEPGDLVINMTAQSLEDRFLGRVAKVHERAYLNQRIGRFNLKDTSEAGWLHLVLRSAAFANWVATRSEGSKVKHMHWRHIEFYPVPWAERAKRDALLAANESWLESERQTANRVGSAIRFRAAVVGAVFG